MRYLILPDFRVLRAGNAARRARALGGFGVQISFVSTAILLTKSSLMEKSGVKWKKRKWPSDQKTFNAFMNSPFGLLLFGLLFFVLD